MVAALTADQEQLRSLAHEVLTDLSPETEVRRLMATESGWDAKAWQQLADVGLLGLAIPEEYGGGGFGLVETGIVAEQAGSTLLCAPFLSSAVLATQLLLRSDNPAAAADYLPAMAAGTRTATVALTEDSGRWDAGALDCVAERGAAGWSVTGGKTYVLDGATADLLLVVAHSRDGVSVLAVEGNAPGVARAPLETFDQTRRLARLDFDRAPARLICSGWEVVSSLLDEAGAVLAAEQVGGAERTLNLAVDYAKTREQFGRPIGSFQAIKHHCANMLMHVEAARSTAYHALWSAALEDGELPVAASVAQAYCSDAFDFCAATSLQIHGGIGFTWEHPIQLYVKRAKGSQVLFGTATHHRSLIADRAGMTPS